jgi:hypothetical protein
MYFLLMGICFYQDWKYERKQKNKKNKNKKFKGENK